MSFATLHMPKDRATLLVDALKAVDTLLTRDPQASVSLGGLAPARAIEDTFAKVGRQFHVHALSPSNTGTTLRFNHDAVKEVLGHLERSPSALHTINRQLDSISGIVKPLEDLATLGRESGITA